MPFIAHTGLLPAAHTEGAAAAAARQSAAHAAAERAPQANRCAALAHLRRQGLSYTVPLAAHTERRAPEHRQLSAMRAPAATSAGLVSWRYCWYAALHAALHCRPDSAPHSNHGSYPEHCSGGSGGRKGKRMNQPQ